MSGEIKYTAACAACGPAVEAGASCTKEFGDEWAYAGYGQCGRCGFNCIYNIFTGKNDICTLGTNAMCKHVRYSADPTACCLGTSTSGTCDPKYTPASGNCDSALANYCAQGDRIVTDPKCINWRNVRPDASRATLKGFCINNLGRKECQDWCRQAGGDCDSAVIGWCSTHHDDPYCTCINSAITDPKYGINPKCVDSKCLSTGYITQNMKNTACPDITNCEVQAQLINSGISLAGVTINQNCGKSPTTQPSVPPQPTPGSTVPTQPAASVSLLSNQWVILFIFIFIVLVAFILIFVGGNGSNNVAQTFSTF